eukprot:jgi/Hompol1/4198/HPOL_003562-RA
MIDDDGEEEEDDDDEDMEDADEDDDQDDEDEEFGNVNGEEDDGDDEDGDEDEDDEDDDADLGKRHTSASKSKSLFKPPTNDEIQQLTQTGELFKSNLFKLQIEELVREVSVNYTKLKPLESALHKLKSILDNAPPRPVLEIGDAVAQLKKEDIVVPFGFAQPAKDAKIKVSFEKPAKVAIVGSFLLHTIAKQPAGVNVDVAVQIPETLIRQKDHLNYKYFQKRAYYIACIAAELKKHAKAGEFAVSTEFAAFQNDLLRPVLVISSSSDAKNSDTSFAKTGFVIRVFPYISASVFAAARLAPSRNGVRVSEKEASSVAVQQPPTPQYNAAILQDTGFVAHLNFLHHHISETPAFKEACILARVWIAQRGLSENYKRGYGLSGFLFSMIMGWMLRASGKYESKRLSKSFSAYQMLKAAIDFIAAMLKDRVADNFDNLFLKKVDRPLLKFDNIVRLVSFTILSIPALKDAPAAYKNEHGVLDYPDLTLFALRFISKMLKRALSDRTIMLTAFAPAYTKWPSSANWKESNTENTEIIVGLVLHTENSLRMVEAGPEGDNIAAVNAFRELWGEKSELRRFQDGSITESVVFETDGTLQQRSLIVCRMAAHLLARHMKLLPSDGLTFWGGLGGKFIKPLGIEQSFGSFQPLLDAFLAFTSEIKKLKELPLSITSVLPASDALRYTSVFVPQPKPSPSQFLDGYRPLITPINVIIQFESSSKWPEELRAVQNMKRAFYIRLGQLITNAIPGSRIAVSVGTNETIVDSGWLDVTHPSGFLFRCRIHYDREQVLLERAFTLAKKSGTPSDVISVKAAQRVHQRDFVHTPWHATQMNNLCLRFPFLPVTVRILKRWLSSHLLLSASHFTSIPEEVTELLAAYVYLNPAPYQVPSSGFAGFLRVLELVQSWDWRDEPLIVEMDQDSRDPSLINRVKDAFKASRAAMSNTPVSATATMRSPAMYIATQGDIESAWWTHSRPTPKILERFIMLARSTLAFTAEKFDHATNVEISQLFTTPLLGYSLIIHLNPQKCPRFRENLTFAPDLIAQVKTKYKNLVTAKDHEAAILCEFDPVEQYMHDLETAFSGVALFFHDRYGGDKIAVVWHSRVVTAGPWKVNLAYNAAPQMDSAGSSGKGSKATVYPNTDAMIAEMERLGAGLVVAIERR